jgi:hypothetical protein
VQFVRLDVAAAVVICVCLTTQANGGPKTVSQTSTALPRWGRLPTARERSGLSKGKLYGLAEKHRGLFRKVDAATIVDLHMLDQILADQPPAELGNKQDD